MTFFRNYIHISNYINQHSTWRKNNYSSILLFALGNCSSRFSKHLSFSFSFFYFPKMVGKSFFRFSFSSCDMLKVKSRRGLSMWVFSLMHTSGKQQNRLDWHFIFGTLSLCLISLFYCQSILVSCRCHLFPTF